FQRRAGKCNDLRSRGRIDDSQRRRGQAQECSDHSAGRSAVHHSGRKSRRLGKSGPQLTPFVRNPTPMESILRTCVRASLAIFAVSCLSAFKSDAAEASAPANSSQALPIAWAHVPQILARIKAPAFPDRHFSITNFGAVGDGQFDCTEAL